MVTVGFVDVQLQMDLNGICPTCETLGRMGRWLLYGADRVLVGGIEDRFRYAQQLAPKPGRYFDSRKQE